MAPQGLRRHSVLLWVFLSICHLLSPTKAEPRTSLNDQNANLWQTDEDFKQQIKALKAGLEFLTLRLEIMEMNNEKYSIYFTKFDRRLQVMEEIVEKLARSMRGRYEAEETSATRNSAMNLTSAPASLQTANNESSENLLNGQRGKLTIPQNVNSNEGNPAVEIRGDLVDHFNGKENLKICVKNAEYKEKCSDLPYPSSCADSHTINCSNNKCRIRNRLYGADTFVVACNETSHGGGWTVIQRRVNGSVDFLRNWFDYKHGFGDLDGDFWMGLEKMHALTTTLAPVELLIEMQDFDNVVKYARYDDFAIGDEASHFTLTNVGNYSGTAGDAFSYNKGHKFSATDLKNDKCDCVQKRSSGWWHNCCTLSNFNGRYFMRDALPKDGDFNGIHWPKFHGNYYSMQFTQMMIRPRDI